MRAFPPPCGAPRTAKVRTMLSFAIVAALLLPLDTPSLAQPACAVVANQPEHEVNIDWMWNNLGKPRPGHIFLVVSAGPPPVFRGNTSANGCVVKAIQAARANKNDLALRWLVAGQIHNEGARRSIERAGMAAVDYAVKVYGARVK
jgi:hypothetical protein